MREIITCSHYPCKYDVKPDLILLDLDDVVFTPKQYVCSTTFFGSYFRQNKDKSHHQLVRDFYECQNATKYRSVSQQLNDDFNKLSYSNCVIGLTARFIYFASETTQQIESVGGRFSNVHNMQDGIYKGVIYAGYNASNLKPNNKGVVLMSLIDKGYFGFISNIVFFDDSKKNLLEVQDALPSAINFLGIHYTQAFAELHREPQELSSLGKFQHELFKISGYLPSDEDFDTLGYCPI